MHLLSELIIIRYAPKPACAGRQRTAFLLICEIELSKWLEELPPELRLDTASSSIRIPHVFTTHMVYHTAIILLHKPFLDELRHSGFSDNRPEYLAAEPSRDSLVVKANVACYEAAKAICAVSQKYREIFGSFRRSPLTATHCNLMASLVFLQRQRRGEKGKKNYFDSCAKVLEELSESWNPASRLLRNMLKLRNSDLSSQPLTQIAHEDYGGSTRSSRLGESVERRMNESPGIMPYIDHPNPATSQSEVTNLGLEDLRAMDVDMTVVPYLISDDLSFAFDSLPRDYSVFEHLSSNPI